MTKRRIEAYLNNREQIVIRFGAVMYIPKELWNELAEQILTRCNPAKQLHDAKPVVLYVHDEETAKEVSAELNAASAKWTAIKV